jgi:uncharacterized membrane protein
MAIRATWWLLAVLVCGIAAYALLQAFSPASRGDLVAGMLAYSSAGSLLHFLAGATVIIAGILQFNQTLRKRHLHWHRMIGRVYVLGVAVGAVAGFYMALNASGGLVARVGFALLALCWLFATGKAFLEIRAGNVSAHRAWMMRSYALTLAALTLRLYIPLFLIAGVPFEAAYPVIAWLCWVPNLLLVDWLLPVMTPRPLTSQ